MEKTALEKSKCCPVCASPTGQLKKGYNRSGTQRCLCKKCGVTYTIDPKKESVSGRDKKTRNKNVLFLRQ